MINLSVCIPTFNRKEYLERAILSVQYQLGDRDEIVIQDNCSEDGTNDMIVKYITGNPQIKYFRNESNIGPVLNFGKVIENTTNDHIYFLTDDDYLLPDAIRKVRAFFENNNARIFKTAFFYYNEKSKTGECISSFVQNVGKVKATISEAVAIYNAAHIVTGLCFEKNLFCKTELEDNKNNWYPSMLLVGAAGLDVGYLSEPTNIHTWENETFWGIDPSKQDELNRGEMEIIKYLYDKKYITDQHLLEMITEHVKIYPDQDNTVVIRMLEQKDQEKVKNSLSALIYKRRIKNMVDAAKNLVKKALRYN